MAKAGTVAGEMEERKLRAAANRLREGVGETAACLLPGFPANHRIKQSICAKKRALGAADVFLEIITRPFLGFDGIVPGSSNQATV